jgi:hypothetical protein
MKAKEKDRRLGPRLGPSMDIIDGLDQFFVVAHRSATLDGDLPTRAVQWCPPMVEGTAAGVHLVTPKQLLISRAESGALRLGLPEPVLARVARQAERVDRLAELGLLRQGGEWHRLLRDRLYWGQGDTIHIWTGHLVRPRPGVVLYLTSAFNRRCATTASPRLFEAREWIPLVLSLAVPEGPDAVVCLFGDVACLLPLSSRATIVKHSLSEAPEVGHQFNAFFDKSYWDKNRSPARYRDLIKGEVMAGPEDPTCKLVVAGPDACEIGPLAPVASAEGPELIDGVTKTPGVTLRSICEVRGNCDGHVIMVKRGPLNKRIAALHEQWSALYGEETLATLPSLSNYLFPSPQGRREVLIRPWVFMATPPGWSTVIDGLQAPLIEGLRGVMSTDKHHSVPLVFKVQESGRFVIPRGAPIAQLIPVPRELLRTTFTISWLDKLDERTAAAI